MLVEPYLQYVGQEFQISINKKRKKATVLAIIGNLAFIEYQTVTEQGALVSTGIGVVPTAKDAVYKFRQLDYTSVPTYWLQEMVRFKQYWIGVGKNKKAPSPYEILVSRKKEKDYRFE